MSIFKMIKQRHQEECYLIEAQDWDEAYAHVLDANIEPYANGSVGNDGEIDGEELDEEDAQLIMDTWHLKQKDLQPSS